MSPCFDTLPFEPTAAFYASFIELFPDAVLSVDKSSIIEAGNTAAHEMFGYADGEMVGQSIEILIPESKRSIHASHVTKYFANPTRRMMGSTLSFFGARKDGAELPVDIMLGALPNIGPPFIMCVIRDMSANLKSRTQLREALAREQNMSRTDSLTGATNFRHFHYLLGLEMDRHKRYARPFSVAYFDLDNFKQINDEYGHSEGDEVLRSMVNCTKNHARKCDIVGRMGGDEFAILMPETDLDEAKFVMNKIQGNLLTEMKARSWPVTFSIGVLTCRRTPEVPDEVIKIVDGLMYGVKRGGKNAITHDIY